MSTTSATAMRDWLLVTSQRSGQDFRTSTPPAAHFSTVRSPVPQPGHTPVFQIPPPAQQSGARDAGSG
jgi:hypothetical protein